MCSEHITFVWVVDHRSWITVGKVWSLQYSHKVCLASADHPYEAPGLIGSSRMLVRCRILSMVDADRTPSIDVCRFLEYSKSSTEIVEKLMKLSLKFGGLTTLVAHLLTSRILGRNPKVLSEKPCILSVSFLFSSFLFFSHTEGLSHATLSLTDQIYACPTFSLILKWCKTASFQYFHRVRG